MAKAIVSLPDQLLREVCEWEVGPGVRQIWWQTLVPQHVCCEILKLFEPQFLLIISDGESNFPLGILRFIRTDLWKHTDLGQVHPLMHRPWILGFRAIQRSPQRRVVEVVSVPEKKRSRVLQMRFSSCKLESALPLCQKAQGLLAYSDGSWLPQQRELHPKENKEGDPSAGEMTFPLAISGGRGLLLKCHQHPPTQMLEGFVTFGR